MDNMYNIMAQEAIERKFNRKHIDSYIEQFIESDAETQAKVIQGVELLRAYIGKSYYKSKNLRIAQIANLDLKELVISIFVGIAYCLREELFTSVTSKLAGRLHFSDKKDSITTVAELVAVLCNTDAFDITKASTSASLVVISRLNLPQQIIDSIEESEFLPPMVCKPLELENNFSSGYLSHKESLILKKNHHDGDICLDVLNTLNGVQLQLDTAFLSTVEETPKTAPKDQQEADNWMNFKKTSYRFYQLIAANGNRFYLTHKVDKRGRIYAHGYHITTQGSSFKKASIELAKEELVTGV